MPSGSNIFCLESNKQFEDIKKVTAIGTGMIGPDISLCVAMAGFPVTMMGLSDKSLARGVARFEKNLAYLVENSVYSSDEAKDIRSKLSTSKSLAESVEGSQVVVEGIVEVLETKQALFKDLEDLCPEDTLLVSGTSGLPSNAISANMKHRNRSMVMHFWNPPYMVPLVECVPNEDTSQETIDTCRAWLEYLGKAPIFLKKDMKGHIGNRLQHALLRESFHLIQEGAVTAQEIDQVFRSCLGPRYANIGLMEYMESVGWDLQVKVQEYLLPDLAADQSHQKILLDLYEAGTWGAKTNRGMYPWAEGDLDQATQRQNRLFLDIVRSWKNSRSSKM